jgi:hypothetical protein
MSRRTDDLYLVDLLDASDAIARSLRGIAFDQFLAKNHVETYLRWKEITVDGPPEESR